MPPPRIRPTPAPTPTRAVAIARPRGRFTSCAHHLFRRRRTSRSSSRPSPCSSSPTYCPTHGRNREPTDARRHGYGAVALLGLTPSAGASRFRAAPTGLLSSLVCSLPIYLAVYYLCRLHMPRSSSCPSPAMNKYFRLFPSPSTLRNLGSGGGEGWGSLICCLWYSCVHKKYYAKSGDNQ
jgi:hypothetical protein